MPAALIAAAAKITSVDLSTFDTSAHFACEPPYDFGL
jgi:hypothetical protein